MEKFLLEEPLGNLIIGLWFGMCFGALLVNALWYRKSNKAIETCEEECGSLDTHTSS